jgi:putative ABC transport system substrate-binding protein
MRRREFISALGGVAAWPVVAQAQQAKKIPRIGVLWQEGSAQTHPYWKPLRDGFKDVGYAQGDLIFEDRFMEKDHPERVDLLAKELVDLKCDVLIGVTIPPALALKRATSTIPIVFVFNSNPVASGVVSNFNHPGGNVTGITHIGSDVAAKRVEVLRDTIPGLSSVALIWDTTPAMQEANRPEREVTQAAASRLGLAYEMIDCGGPEALEEAISKASQFGAAVLMNSAWHVFNQKRIAELFIARKLAAVGQADVFADAGLLMTYGANWTSVARSAAPLVKKILDGEKAGDIPVHQPTAFDLVFNRKTAQAIGLQIPPIMLARATRVID